ncbi:2-oxo acid dehydrogenase subunit E2, partial [Oceanispirochaeta sp.]|uniref:2-oxo acid dehydrogenase subunit E2 n=1 Tax=Oceanispirochaeta sp. TaxID=2035350 RepID=UPI00260334A6
MAFKNRSDGTLITDLPSFRGMLPFLMKTKTESIIYFEQEIDVTETLSYIRQFNESMTEKSKKITIFHVFLCAFVRTIALRPQLNRFISGYKYYQRNEISINFVAKKVLSDEAEEINVKIAFNPGETLRSLPARVHRYLNKARSLDGNINSSETDFLMKFPGPVLRLIMKTFRLLDYWNLAPAGMIRVDPMYSSLFLTNLGSVGVDAPFHHLFEWGNNGLFAAIGKIKRVYSMNKEGQII